MSLAAAIIARELAEIETAFKALEREAPAIEAGGAILIDALKGGGRILFCGNGGSAADAQHLAAELSGRYQRDRAPLAGLALTVDT